MQIGGGTYVKRERMRIGWIYANREKGLISIQASADFSLIYHLFHKLLKYERRGRGVPTTKMAPARGSMIDIALENLDLK